MRKLQSILWATDLHPSTKIAAQVVADLAWRFDSQVTLYHVTADSRWALVDDRRRTIGRKLLDEVAEGLTSQKVVVKDSLVVTGSPADRILRQAEEMNADLILLGAGGKVKDGVCFAGPTTMAVMEHARQPVMAIMPGETTPTFRRILCPIDFSETSRRGLDNAIRLARAFRGQLFVGTVFPGGGWMESLVATSTGLDVDADVEKGWRSDFDSFIRRTDFGDVEYLTDVRRGVPYEQISAMASEHRCDVIVMGATGRTGLARLLMGSVTRRVLQQLPCSIVIVHDEDILMENLTEDDLRNSKLLYAEGAALLDSCHYEAALAKFDQVLVRNPFHLEALEGRAVACDHLNQADRAARCRRRAEIIRSESPRRD